VNSQIVPPGWRRTLSQNLNPLSDWSLACCMWCSHLGRLTKSGLEACVEQTLRNVLYNKLLMNLVNPVNALAGVDIPSTMRSRGHRLVRVETFAVQRQFSTRI